jgi:TP901 family phage tail tape measure protein
LAIGGDSLASDVEKRITAKMVLDSTGFNSTLQGVNQQLKVAQSELKASSEQVGVFGKESDKLKVTTEGLSKQIELQRQKVDIYKDSIEKATKRLQDTIKARDDLKEKLQEETSKYNEVIKLYGKESEEAKKAKESLEALTDEYKKKEKQVESTAKSINNYTINMNKADAELSRLQGELQKSSEELGKLNNKWLQASDVLKNSSERIKATGETVSRVGNGLLEFSTPLISAGIASGKFAMDFENSMAMVSTISDDTQVPINELGNEIIKLSDDTGIAATSISANVYDAISAGQETGDAVNFVTNSTKLAKAGFAEAGQSLDLLTTILNAYKMKSTEVANVSDLLIQVQNKGKVTVGELSADMGKLIPTAVATNTSLQQLGSGYAIMTSNGIKSAESTTYMNSMLNELSQTGTSADKALRKVSGKSFAELMACGKSLGDVLNILNSYAKKSKLSLSDMFGSSEAGKAALVLSTNAGRDFNDMLKDMNSAAGATDAAFEKVNNTAGERLNKSLNQLKNNSIKLGSSLLPIVDDISQGIGTLADKLGNMDEEQLKTIADIALFTVGLGGILKVSGGVISTIGTITGGISKLSGILGGATIAAEGVGTAAEVAAGVGGATGLAGLGASLGGVVVAAAPFLIAGAAVAGVGYGIYKGMTEEAIPAVDLFADKVETTSTSVSGDYGSMAAQVETNTIKISESTKKAVSAYVDMDNGVRNELQEMFISSTTITEQNKNELIGKFDTMGNTIKDGLKQKLDESLNNIQSFFAQSNTLSTLEETTILQNTTTYYNTKQGLVNTYETQIKEILNKASQEKRSITLDEQKTINDIQNKMREEGVKALSQNEIEAKVIIERMKDFDKRMTAEQAAEKIRQLNESRDKAVKIANDEYDKRISTIIKLRDEAGAITSDQADKLIADAKRQRDGIVDQTEDTRIEALAKMRQLNNDLDQEVDTGTGNILTWWDKLKRWWNGWTPESKSFSYQVKSVGPNVIGHGAQRVDANASGTDYFRGGLTTLHEKGYEVYDLPRGTRIYNHEASEDMVMKTAEAVATKLLGSNSNNSGVSIVQNIYSTVDSPAEMARQSRKEFERAALDW